MKTLVAFLAVTAILCLCVKSSFADSSKEDSLVKQMSRIEKECEKIKPGMTRSELLQIFTTEDSSVSTGMHQTFIYRGCLQYKVDVDFAHSDLKSQQVDPKTDVIIKISKPYLYGFQT